MPQSLSPDLSQSNRGLVWVLSSALLVTVLFVSFSLYFSRSRAADATPGPAVSEASISNNAPEIATDGVVVSIDPLGATIGLDSDFDTAGDFIGTQQAITPTASSTLTAYVHILVRDANGWEDIDPDSLDPGNIDYQGYLKNNGGGQCTTENEYDCYTPLSNLYCERLAHADNLVQVVCVTAFKYFMKPGTWDVAVVVTDRAGLTDSYNGTFTVNNVLAYSLSPSTINFGSVSVPFSGITNANKPVNFANAGNTGIAQLQVDHTAMACAVSGSPTGSIPASDMAYSTSTISSLSDYYEIGVSTGTDFGFPIPAQTNSSTYQVNTLYNHLVGVPNGTSGSCSGTITFTPSS